MKEINIYEPVMCCNTGVSGVGIDSELMRISTVMKVFKNLHLTVRRLDLSKTPKEFMKNREVMAFLKENTMNALPITTVDGKIFITNRYPTNEEFSDILGISLSTLENNIV